MELGSVYRNRYSGIVTGQKREIGDENVNEITMINEIRIMSVYAFDRKLHRLKYLGISGIMVNSVSLSILQLGIEHISISCIKFLFFTFLFTQHMVA